jgi:CHAT domain-containing protein/Tfp pilus assembly protein PilF
LIIFVGSGAFPQSAPQEVTGVEGLDEVKELIRNGRYAEAESAASALLAEMEAQGKGDTVETAQVLDVLVESLWRGGKARAPKTMELARRAIAIKEETLGPDHPEVAVSVYNLAVPLVVSGDHAGAKPQFERALAIREKALGPDHPLVAASLNGLANLLKDIGDYDGAMAAYERALAIREKTAGPDDPSVAVVLDNLGNLLAHYGNIATARANYERALAIREKNLGPEHPALARNLNNLAILLYDIGDWDGAGQLYERSLQIREKSLGPEHPDVAESLNNMGALLMDMSDYAGARPLFERAITIREEALGPEHPFLATALNNLAELLTHTGDYTEATSHFEHALAVFEKSLGPDHYRVAQVMTNFAHMCYLAGNTARAKELEERALAISEKTLGANHFFTAVVLYGLSIVHMEEKDYTGAKELLERSVSVFQESLGAGHPRAAQSVNELGRLLYAQGDYAGAVPYLERSVNLLERSLGPDHPSVARSLNDLARVRFEMGDMRSALDAALQAEEIGRNHLYRTARTLAERQALRYATVRASGIDLCLSIAAEGLVGDARMKVWDVLMRSRALVLDEMAARHRAIAGAAEIGRLAEELAAAHQRLANLMVRGPGDESTERYRRILDEARREKERAERALAERSVAFQGELERRQAGMADITSALPPESGLIAFARYHRYEKTNRPTTSSPFDGGPGGEAARSEPISSYLAFAFGPGGEEPFVVPLGIAEEIESLIAKWSTEAAEGALVTERREASAEASYRAAGEALRAKIWDPVAPYMEGARRVFVVPDGAINLVSFASLPVGEEAYLVEKGPLVHYLSAERDLVDMADRRTIAGGLLVLGGPNFDERSLFATLEPTDEKEPMRVAGIFRGSRSGCGEFQSMRFEPLPGSAREAEELVALWKKSSDAAAGGVTHLTGAGASETAFKLNAAGQRVLHLATHGFFLSGPCPSALGSARGVGGLAKPGPEEVEGENPLLLSGLALAGANHRQSAGPDEDDGVLTAEEIASLDLSGVEWAVLSACDTGVGQIQAGEGIFGLRRAFQVAGAGTLIMTLWAVEDESAREWMRALYDARLMKGSSTAEAVREASLQVLRQCREAGRTTHPFFWGGFVAAGDWR